MSKKIAPLMGLLVIAGLLLAACQPAAAPFECTDTIGCVTIAPGDPIHIAWAMVVSGGDSTLGIDSRRGVEIAVDDKDGTLLGHPIELTGEDTGCNAEGGQAAAQKLVADPTIISIIGTSCSSEARVAAPIISDAGITMISASNTAPDLTAEGTHVAGYLRTAHNDNFQGAVGAEFAYNSLAVRRVATIHDGSPYAQGLVGVFEARFKELGGEIVSSQAVGPDDTDMRPVLTTIAAATPDFLYFPIFIEAGGFVAAQSREITGLETVPLMGADGMFSPNFLTAAGSASEGMYHSSPDFSAFTSGYQAFLDKHQAKYGENVLSAFHAHAYDATNIIFAAIEKVAVQEADGTLHIGRQALRDALFATTDFPGLTGTLSCSPLGDCGAPVIAVYQVQSSDAADWNPGAAADTNPKKI